MTIYPVPKLRRPCEKCYKMYLPDKKVKRSRQCKECARKSFESGLIKRRSKKNDKI